VSRKQGNVIVKIVRNKVRGGVRDTLNQNGQPIFKKGTHTKMILRALAPAGRGDGREAGGEISETDCT